MKFLLLLGLTVVLFTSFIVSSVSASTLPPTTRHCTASYPCNYRVCGDHICASGEYDQLRATIIGAQQGSAGSSGVTSGNMTITSPSTGTVIGGVVSYVDNASDGTIVVVRTGHRISGQPLSLGIGFFTADRNAIQHQNYAITVSQDNVTVFSNPTGHTHTGLDTMTTSPLSSSNPISIEVTLNGVGLPTADPSTWTGTKGEVLDFLQGPTDEITAAPVDTTAVPEFGPVASIVLAISVLSIVFVAKTRVIPRL